MEPQNTNLASPTCFDSRIVIEQVERLGIVVRGAGRVTWADSRRAGTQHADVDRSSGGSGPWDGRRDDRQSTGKSSTEARVRSQPHVK